MTKFPSAISLLARQVRLLVAPPTTTLFESRTILSEVQSKFGSICTFISQRNDPVLDRLLKSGPQSTVTSPGKPPSQTILAVFSSPVARKVAVDSTPLTISCGGDLVPSAKELDPYNARGFRGRHHPPNRTFTCEIVAEEDPTLHGRLSKENPYSGPFHPDTLQMSYEDLTRSRVGLSEMTGEGLSVALAGLNQMADVMQTERPVPARGQQGKEEGLNKKRREPPFEEFYSESDRLRDPERNGGLMAAWKWGWEKEKAEKEAQCQDRATS